MMSLRSKPQPTSTGWAESAQTPLTPPQPKEVDLGPIRIESCKFVKNTGSTGKYNLVLNIGPNTLEIVTSTHGNNVYVHLNGNELTGSGDDA